MTPEPRPAEEPAFSAEVDAADAGQRLDQYLAEPLGSRAQAVRMIEAGLVTVNGLAVPKRHVVASGDRVSVAPELLRMSPASGTATARYSIVYEDADLIVVDKAAGVVVHPARGHMEGTLVQALSDRAAGGEEDYRAGIVHRLDKDTSGLLVVAKSDEVHRRLKVLLSTRELRREYLALVDGIPPARSGTIEAPIGRDRHDRVLMSIDTDAARDARTHFEILEAHASSALLKVILDTGRTHQIRVHMQAIGHPVCGDRTYGGSARFELTRQFLHAARLAFPHPVTGVALDLNSPLPEDLERALQLARTGG